VPLIVAIEKNGQQVARLTPIVRGLGAELVVAQSAAQAFETLGNRVPDLILVPLLLPPQDETALTTRLRDLGAAAAHIRTLSTPLLATSQAHSGSTLSILREGDSEEKTVGCAPDIFGAQLREYLEHAARERASAAAEQASCPETTEANAAAATVNAETPDESLVVADAAAKVAAAARAGSERLAALADAEAAATARLREAKQAAGVAIESRIAEETRAAEAARKADAAAARLSTLEGAIAAAEARIANAQRAGEEAMRAAAGVRVDEEQRAARAAADAERAEARARAAERAVRAAVEAREAQEQRTTRATAEANNAEERVRAAEQAVRAAGEARVAEEQRAARAAAEARASEARRYKAETQARTWEERRVKYAAEARAAEMRRAAARATADAPVAVSAGNTDEAVHVDAQKNRRESDLPKDHGDFDDPQGACFAEIVAQLDEVTGYARGPRRRKTTGNRPHS
jgi:hypothetical protein